MSILSKKISYAETSLCARLPAMIIQVSSLQVQLLELLRGTCGGLASRRRLVLLLPPPRRHAFRPSSLGCSWLFLLFFFLLGWYKLVWVLTLLYWILVLVGEDSLVQFLVHLLLVLAVHLHLLLKVELVLIHLRLSPFQLLHLHVQVQLLRHPHAVG